MWQFRGAEGVLGECCDERTVPKGATRPGQCANGGGPFLQARGAPGLSFLPRQGFSANLRPRPGPRVPGRCHSDSFGRLANTHLNVPPSRSPSSFPVQSALSCYPWALQLCHPPSVHEQEQVEARVAEGRKSRCFRSAFREEFLDVQAL